MYFLSEISLECCVLKFIEFIFPLLQDKLFPYAEENVQKFLESEWDKDDVKEAVVGLRKLALEDKDNKVDGVVEIPGEVRRLPNLV